MRFLFPAFQALSILALAILGQTPLAAQGYDQYLRKLTAEIPGKPALRIQQDERMTTFVDKHAAAMHAQQSQGIPGFRIRIFFDGSQSARMKMNQEKARFLKLFDNLPVYPDYKAPYWRIYVGDFRTASEALKEYDRIRKYYPNALMVNDYIRIPEMKNPE